jgi:hypothetical protein
MIVFQGENNFHIDDEITELKELINNLEDALKLKASDQLVMEHIGQLQDRMAAVESAVAKLERRTESVLDATIKVFTANRNDGLIMLKRNWHHASRAARRSVRSLPNRSRFTGARVLVRI